MYHKWESCAWDKFSEFHNLVIITKLLLFLFDGKSTVLCRIVKLSTDLQSVVPFTKLFPCTTFPIYNIDVLIGINDITDNLPLRP